MAAAALGPMLLASAASAQTLRPASRSAATPGLLAAYDFHLSAAAFAAKDEDERFSWDADLGGDVDLVDYRRGRLNFLANYEAILGSELRAFDPNQSTYTLDFSASVRWRGTELAAVFHHVSRHLTDRAKRIPIDWNMVGMRATRGFNVRGWEVDAAGHALGATKRSTIDYDVESGGDVAARRPLEGRWSRWSLLAAGAVTALATTGSPSRGTLWGSWVEAGMRLDGRGGSLDLFVAHERRIDADPFDRETRSWALVGFRLRAP